MRRLRILRNTLVLTGLLLLLTATAAASGDGLDRPSRDLLIDKLSHVHLKLPPQDSSRTGITLRLADLLAERARLDQQAELAAGCVMCEAGREDRIRALALYQEALPKLTVETLGRVLAQIGHLFELTGQEAAAIETYNRVLKDPISGAVKAEAHLSLAEVFFRRRNYQEAMKHYRSVVETPEAASRGLAAYRLAWCHFHLEQSTEAVAGLERILRDRKLLMRSGTAGEGGVDQQFQEEVSRDLATFLARGIVTVKEAERVYELSPESTRQANSVYLASELERLGQKASAIELWGFVIQRESRPIARLEAQVRKAALQAELKRTKEAVGDYKQALALWQQIGSCDAAECPEIRTRLSNFIIDWHKLEKKEPSAELLGLYVEFLRVFPADSDMNLFAAQVSQAHGEHVQAARFYTAAAKSPAPAAHPAAEARARLETVLLAQIENAEISKDKTLREAAYSLYLEMSPEGSKRLEVRYQRAHLLYDAGEAARAADALREVALSAEKGPEALRKQAADLSLDALVIIKDDVRLEKWAGEYATRFPVQAEEYRRLAQKSILNQAADVAGDSERAWDVLSRMNVAQAGADEKAAYYKNRLILAEKLRKFSEARVAADALVHVPGIKNEDRDFALARKAYLSELVLDFEGALKATEQIRPESLGGGKKWLRLAMFADLARQDARPFYQKYLKEAEDASERRAIAAQLVRSSDDPEAELTRQFPVLNSDGELLAQLYLEAYARSKRRGLLDKALKIPVIVSSPSGAVLRRIVFLDHFDAVKSKVVGHQIDGQSQKKLAAGLRRRMDLLTELEKLAGTAVQSGDWTAQLLGLDLLARESQRFYEEILSLPVPAGLSPEEEQQYLGLLGQQAAPHQIKAHDLGAKTAEFWSNAPALNALTQAYSKQSPELQTVFRREMERLAEIAPENPKELISTALAAPVASEVKPTLAELEGARQRVRENPFDRDGLEGLRTLELRRGHAAMVSYLDTRLESLSPSTDVGTQNPEQGVLK